MRKKIDSFEWKIESIITQDETIENLDVVKVVISISKKLITNLSNNKWTYTDLMTFHTTQRRNELCETSIKLWSKRWEHFTNELKEQIMLSILLKYLAYGKVFFERSYHGYENIGNTSVDLAEWLLWLLWYSKWKLVKIKTILPYIDLKKWINISTDYLTGNMIREAEIQYLMLQNGNYIKIIQNLRQELFNVFGKKFTNQEWTENQISLIKKVDDDLKILQWPYFSEPEVQLYNFNLLHNMELLKEALKKFKK